MLAGAAQAQTAAGPTTVVVEPSGGDDTEALQEALEQCSGAAPGCIIELAAGTFRTRPLVVRDFHGSLQGAGRTTTIIEAIPGIEVVQAEPAVIAVPPTPEDPWPFLISFIDGDIHVSDLTLRITEAWTIAGNDMAGLDVRGQWIVLGEGATNNTVVCDTGVTAIDGGVGNRVACE